MKMLAAALALAATTVPAYAMTYFLTDQWMSSGNRFCKYGNGSVMNVGINLCPLSIQG